MFQSKNFEKALFQWPKWRQSIVKQLIKCQCEPKELTITKLQTIAKQELKKLDFPSNQWLDLYWICCLSSDYNFDHPATFENIVVPDWLAEFRHYKLTAKTRAITPIIWNEKDARHFARQYGLSIEGLKKNYEGNGRIYLPPNHELFKYLDGMKGRPKEKSDKIGRRPTYSDRMAVKYAIWKDELKNTYEEIGNKVSIFEEENLYHPIDVKHLVDRGRKLLSDHRLDLAKIPAVNSV